MVEIWTNWTSVFIFLNVLVLTLAVLSLKKQAPPAPQQQQHHHQFSPPLAQPEIYRAPSLFSRLTSFNYNPNPNLNPIHDFPAPPAQNPSLLSRVMSSNYFPWPAQPDLDPDPNPNSFPAPYPPARAPSLLSRVFSFTDPAPERNEEESESPEGHASREQEKENEEGNGSRESHVRNPNPNPNPNRIFRAPSLLSRVFSFSDPVPQKNEEENDSREAHVRRVKSTPETGNEEEIDSRERHVRRRSKKGKETASFGRDEYEGVDAKADDFINRFKQQLKMQRLDSLLCYRRESESHEP